MAQNIYDEDGKLIGTVKSREEADRDSIAAFVDNLGCLAFILGIVAVLFEVAVWVVGVKELLDEGDPLILVFVIPIIVATILAGRKVVKEKKKSPWGVFGFLLLVDAVVGTVSVTLCAMLSDGSVGSFSNFLAAALLAIFYSVAPAAIVALIAHVKKK